MMESQKESMMEQNDKDSLRAWYVIHTYSGYENKVKANLERKVASQGLSDVIFNIVVPVEDETEEKDGRKKVVQRKVFPGYVLVEMIVNNYSWYVVRNTQGVTGFVGSEKDPIPLTDAEAKRILGSMGETRKKAELDVEIGESVRITDGPFADYTAVVKEISPEKTRLKVQVEGKQIDLESNQVERI